MRRAHQSDARQWKPRPSVEEWRGDADCSDLFHYHLDKRIRIETVEGKRIVQIFQASSPLSVWCRSEVLRGILMDIANELRRKLAEAPSP